MTKPKRQRETETRKLHDKHKLMILAAVAAAILLYVLYSGS